MYSYKGSLPPDILDRSIKEKIDYFHKYTLIHPILKAVTEEVLDNIKNPAGHNLFMVIGPTGVGKTTLYKKIMQVFIKGFREDIDNNKGFIPIAGFENISPDNGIFNWKDYYIRVLESLNEPMINNKIEFNFNQTNYTQPVLQASTNSRSTAPALRRSLENAFHFRKTIVFLIDEAQHFTKMASGKRLQDQLDTIKSLANVTNVIHVLIGTYELIPFVNLSGQLDRRTNNVHFHRYKSYKNEFSNIIQNFERQLPLKKESNLIQYTDFLYERSIGCVGILKDWLERCLNDALNKGVEEISYKLLERHALSIATIEKILFETIDGEAMLAEDEEKRKRVEDLLNISSENYENHKIIDNQEKNVRNTKGKRNVGIRKPKRDQVGFEKAE